MRMARGNQCLCVGEIRRGAAAVGRRAVCLLSEEVMCDVYKAPAFNKRKRKRNQCAVPCASLASDW